MYLCSCTCILVRAPSVGIVYTHVTHQYEIANLENCQNKILLRYKIGLTNIILSQPANEIGLTQCHCAVNEKTPWLNLIINRHG